MNRAAKATPISQPSPGVETFRARDIAAALRIDKKTVHARALREGWKMRREGNRWQYNPPPKIKALVAQSMGRQTTLQFLDLPDDSRQRQAVLCREQAVKLVARFKKLGTARARRKAIKSIRTSHPGFKISTSSLRRWEAAYAAKGIDGLVEKKFGNVGRKSPMLPSSDSAALSRPDAAVEIQIQLARGLVTVRVLPDKPQTPRLKTG